MVIPDFSEPDYHSGFLNPPRKRGIKILIVIAIVILVSLVLILIFAPEEEIELSPVQAPRAINQIQRVQEVEAKQLVEKNQASQTGNIQISQIPAKDSLESGKTDGTSQSLAHETPVNPGGSGQLGTINDSGISARMLIKQIRQGEKSLTLEKIYAQAAQFEQQERATDAYLLYFYTARQGHGLSAFALATMNDPAYFTGNNDLLDKADPVQAHKWYSIAAAAQVADAVTRLTNLRSSIEAAATAGDPSAQRLLLNWK